MITQGKTHNFLGMKIHINKNKIAEILTKDKIEEVIKMIGKELKGSVSSPATKKLFIVSPATNQVSNKKSDVFHSVTAKLLFITKREKPDIETAISFLTTMVYKRDDDDWAEESSNMV